MVLIMRLTYQTKDEDWDEDTSVHHSDRRHGSSDKRHVRRHGNPFGRHDNAIGRHGNVVQEAVIHRNVHFIYFKLTNFMVLKVLVYVNE